MRLIVNRQQMVEQAYGGYARIANDMPDPADPAYPALPQREQDIAEAKSLLKAAGYQNLKVTMTIAPQDNDIVNSAQVFAEQASAAGVTVNLTNLTNAAYQVGFTKWPFTQGYWAAGLLGTNYSGRFLPTSTNNDSHWDNAQTNEWYYEQVKTSNPAVRNELLTKIFKVFYDEGPDIIHTFKYNVDVYSSKFTGFVPNDTGGLSFSQYRFRLAQLA
jgi:peptide/nickel transport system substrate-binding protein